MDDVAHWKTRALQAEEAVRRGREMKVEELPDWIKRMIVAAGKNFMYGTEEPTEMPDGMSPRGYQSTTITFKSGSQEERDFHLGLRRMLHLASTANITLDRERSN